MLTAIVFLILGAFIGWAVPQPAWAKKAQEWAVGKLAMAAGKIW